MLKTSKLDQQTPQWPVIRVDLRADPSVTVNGVTTPLTGADPQAQAMQRAADQARANGRPIRATVKTPTGQDRLIIQLDGTAVALDGAATAAAGNNASKPLQQKTGVLSRFPRRVQPLIRWGAPLLAVVMIGTVTAAVIQGHSAQAAPAPAVAPVPPAGQLYTELAPPGWSQQAAWTVQLAADAPAPVAAADGTVVVVLEQDGDRSLTVLEQDGRPRWATPLDSAPRVGPLVLTVDGALVVAVAGNRDLTYWPLAGGPETVVPLPSGAKVDRTGLVTLPRGKAGYLAGGTLQVIELLPRTAAAIAVDGAIIAVQPDIGTWWTLSAGSKPVSVVPAVPAAGAAVQKVLAVTDSQVLISWSGGIVTAYDRNTGTLLASSKAASKPQPATAYSNTAGDVGAGTVVSSQGALTVTAGLAVTAVVDQVYGTLGGDPVVVSSTGGGNPLPAGTLIPVGMSGEYLLVLGASNTLYALNR